MHKDITKDDVKLLENFNSVNDNWVIERVGDKVVLRNQEMIHTVCIQCGSVQECASEYGVRCLYCHEELVWW